MINRRRLLVGAGFAATTLAAPAVLRAQPKTVKMGALRLPMIDKPLAITYGTAELPPLVADSRALHEKRAAQHLAGPLIPVAGADHFTITHELRDADGILTRQLLLLA